MKQAILFQAKYFFSRVWIPLVAVYAAIFLLTFWFQRGLDKGLKIEHFLAEVWFLFPIVAAFVCARIRHRNQEGFAVLPLTRSQMAALRIFSRIFVLAIFAFEIGLTYGAKYVAPASDLWKAFQFPLAVVIIAWLYYAIYDVVEDLWPGRNFHWGVLALFLTSVYLWIREFFASSRLPNSKSNFESPQFLEFMATTNLIVYACAAGFVLLTAISFWTYDRRRQIVAR